MSNAVLIEASGETTRRRLIGCFALGVGVAGFLGANLTPRRAAAGPAKLAQREIGYQPMPKGAARCETCVNWQAPNGCKLVAGPISSSGWCGLYVRKA